MKYSTRNVCAAGILLWTGFAGASVPHAAPIVAGPQATAAEIRVARGESTAKVLRLTFMQSGGEGNGSKVRVDLASDYISVERTDGGYVYDFRLKRQIYIDPRNKTFWNASLYADVAFRVAEAENRLYLGKILTDAGMKNSSVAMSAADVESQLGIAPPNFPKVEFEALKESDGSIGYRNAGKSFLTAQFGATQLQADERTGFARYLRYCVMLPPQIVDAIAADGRVPTAISYSEYEMAKTTAVTLTLAGFERTVADYPLAADFAIRDVAATTPAQTALAPLIPIMRGAARGTAKPGPRTIADYREEIASALEKGNRFDAIVLFLEMSEQYGEEATRCNTDSPPICASQMAALRAANSDPEVQTYARGISYGGRDAEKGVPLLRSLDRKKLSDPYVLDLMIANDIANESGASEMYANAIRGNPYVPGFYKDYGDYLYRQFDTPDAWMLYDFARCLPTSDKAPLVDSINTLEAKLLADFPQYF